MRSIPNRTWLSFALAVTLCASASLGCKFFSKTNMFEGNAAKDAAEAFRKKLGGGSIKALSLELEPELATLKAQDPKNTQHVDEYRYTRGIVTGPTPVQLNMLENNLDKTLFNLDDVDLGATANLAKSALDRAKIEGGKIKKMSIERGLSLATDMIKSGAVSWHIEIQGTRENASAYADQKGNLRGVDLSQTSRAAQFNMFSPDTLRDAGPQIKEAFDGKVKLLEIAIYEKFLSLKAKSPRDNEITNYKYDINGVTTSALSNITDPTPFEVRSGEFKIDEMYFDLDDVNLTMAADLNKKALERLGFADGRITIVSVKRQADKFMSKNLITCWEIHCQQGRKSGSVKYDLSGKELEVYGPR